MDTAFTNSGKSTGQIQHPSGLLYQADSSRESRLAIRHRLTRVTIDGEEQAIDHHPPRAQKQHIPITHFDGMKDYRLIMRSKRDDTPDEDRPNRFVLEPRQIMQLFTDNNGEETHYITIQNTSYESKVVQLTTTPSVGVTVPANAAKFMDESTLGKAPAAPAR